MPNNYPYAVSVKELPDRSEKEPALLTIPQVATQLNISRAHVYTLIKQGLPTIHLGRAVRINAVSLHSWLLEQENYGQASQ